MAKNDMLSAAKRAKKDEFYTRIQEIEAELIYYRPQFKGKTVFLNCDDPTWSAFWRHFFLNCDDPTWSAFWRHFHLLFSVYGLKKLIATHYESDGSASYAMVYEGGSDNDVLTGQRIELEGNGDFRSDECIEFLKESDIVVTNPPFSLFREYVAQLVEYDKKFLIIGNMNAVTYKEVFPLIKDDKLWIGTSIHSGDRPFYVPDDYPLNATGCGIDDMGRRYVRVKGVRWYTNLDVKQRHEELDRPFYVPDDYPLNATGCGIDDMGRRYVRVKGVRWYTNLDVKQRHEELFLSSTYYKKDGSVPQTSLERWPRYDNYDAIEVSKTKDIPVDYEGVMGVPITFLDKYNPEQFEIIGASESEGKGFSQGLWVENSGIAQPLVDSERKYKRLFIRARHPHPAGVPVVFDEYE